MPIIQSLRNHFARALRNILPGRALADPQPSKTAELITRINEIDSFYAPALQKNLHLTQTPSGPLPEFDWACLLANRVGPPAGLRTRFSLKWMIGTGQHVFGTPPKGTLLSFEELNIVLPLEELLPQMMAQQERKKKTNRMDPCGITFERPNIGDMQTLVKDYRALHPRDNSHLRIVK